MPTRDGLTLLVWGRAVSAVGEGLWFTIWALYFTRILGVPAGVVGLGMAVAAAAGLGAAVLLGTLADRSSPRTLLIVVVLIRAGAMAGYLLVQTPWTFLVVTTAFVALANGGNAVRTSLVVALVRDNGARITALARQRVAQHLGYALGAGFGAMVLTTDSPAWYAVAVVGNALTLVAFATIVVAVPAPSPSSGGGDLAAVARTFRDRSYASLTGAVALLSLCWAMLSAGLPIWISRWTRLPLSLSGVVIVISSIGIAVLQVPATTLARTTARAARITVWSGAVLAASCVLLATSTGSGLVAVAVVLAAALLHLAGELGYVASSWVLSVNLMREEARGAYQGIAEAATATVQIFGPAVFTIAIGTFGPHGWLLIAAVFLLAGTPVPALTRWAVRTR